MDFEFFTLNKIKEPLLIIKDNTSFVNNGLEALTEGEIKQGFIKDLDILPIKSTDTERFVIWVNHALETKATKSKPFIVQSKQYNVTISPHPQERSAVCQFQPVQNVKRQTLDFFNNPLDLPNDLEKLQSQHDTLLCLCENAPLLFGLIEIVDNDVMYLYVNKAMEAFTQVSSHELIGKKCSAYGITRDALDFWIERYHKARDLNTAQAFEVGPNNKGRLFSCTVAHVKEETYVFICMDITDRNFLEQQLKNNQIELENTVQKRTEQLEHALQVKSRFLATMSHEIRTPLTGIMGSMTLLSNTSLSLEQLDLVRISHTCGEQLLVVIDDVLDFTKMEENKVTLTKVEFSLRNIVEESLDIVSFNANKMGIELISDIAPNLQDRAVGDDSRLRQVMVNLLSNAVKFSHTNASVICKVSPVEISEVNNTITILFSVRDTGIGIPYKAQNSIFQPFQQADSSASRKYGGSGLGLSISKRLVELMGGTMNFSSEPDVGSTFYFTITTPLDDRPQPGPILGTSGARVLLIDPLLERTKILSTKLSYWGFEVICLNNKNEIKDVLKNTIVDIILSDDWETTELLQNARDLPIIFMGHNPKREYEGKYFLKKPAHENTLKTMLLNVVNNHPKISALTSPRNQIQLNFTSVKPEELRVLLAEDNIMNQRVITKILASCGFTQVTLVDNGLKAVQAVQNCMNPFHLIFMDVMMPEMSGLEATEHIRKLDGIEQPKIIALTADAFVENKTRCLEAGMQDVVTKPLNKSDLIRAVERVYK